MSNMSCTEFEGVASELALGILYGEERAAALDHVETCRACRRELTLLTDAADAIADRDAAAPVVAAMQVLPPEQRQALMAVTLYGLTARELSEATHVPLGTAKSRIRLGLRRLREQLGVRTG